MQVFERTLFFKKLSDEYDIPIIEDAAEALGSKYNFVNY